jgi:tRNA(adenine34) deaminase
VLDDKDYMTVALKQAERAFRKDEVPIGAIVVGKDGKIIGRGYNSMEKIKCQTGHAEVIAIKKACKNIGDWRLDGCTVYVTLEPCTMCFGLIQLSRIKRLVYGAKSPLFGFGDTNFGATKKSKFEVEEGVKIEESKALLQRFFDGIRKRKGV